MAAAPLLTFGRSDFNAFLFASVGEDKAGVDLTVLSALARLGLDPWTEAARLADLPRAAAIQALSKSIALLPLGNWKEADQSDIATRLVDSLPAAGTPIAPPVSGNSMAQLTTRMKLPQIALPDIAWLKSRSTILLVCAAMAVGWLYVLTTYESTPLFESAPTTQR